MGASDQQDLEKQVGQSMLDTSAGLATTSSEQAPFSASGTAQARGSTTVGSSSSSAGGEADIGAVGTMRRNTAAKASGERAEYDEKKVAYDAEHREPPACIKSCQQTLVRWNGSLEAFNRRAKEKRQGRKLAGTRYEVQQNGGKAEGKQKEGDTFVQRHIMVPLVTFIYIWVYIGEPPLPPPSPQPLTLALALFPSHSLCLASLYAHDPARAKSAEHQGGGNHHAHLVQHPLAHHRLVLHTRPCRQAWIREGLGTRE